jgi:hypothetical protein
MHKLDALAISLALFCTLPAQERTSQGFVLKVGDHEIAQVIEDAAGFLGRNYILQPAELMGNKDTTVRLQKALNLDVHGCEEVVSQLAFIKGLMLSPVDPDRGIYEFISLSGPRRGEIRATFMAPEEVLKRRRLKLRVSTSLQFEHINAQLASNSLRPFFAQSSRGMPMSIGAMSSNCLMIQGTADQVADAVLMITSMDRPGAETLNPQPMNRIVSLEQDRESMKAELVALRQKLAALEAGAGKSKGVPR